MGKHTKKPWIECFPKASKNACEALDAMLEFHPQRRPDAKGTIRLAYFKDLHMPDDEPEAASTVDWAFDNFKPTKRLLQNYIYAECWKFHPWVERRDKDLFASRGLELK